MFPTNRCACLPVGICVGLLITLSLHAAHAQDHLGEVTRCKDASDCAAAGLGLMGAHIYAAASEQYAQQVGYSEKAASDCARSKRVSHGDCKAVPLQPYNNAALAALHGGSPYEAQMWLNLSPKSPITAFNQKLVDSALVGFKWPTSPEGQYWQYAGYGLWNQLDVTLDKDSFDITFRGYHYRPDDAVFEPATDSLEDHVPIVQRVAVLHSKDSASCSLTARFLPDQVELSSIGDCGFKEGVAAHGTYMRVNARSGDQELLASRREHLYSKGAVDFSYAPDEIKVDQTGAHVVEHEFMDGNTNGMQFPSRVILEFEVYPCRKDGQPSTAFSRDGFASFDVQKDGHLKQADDSPYLYRPMLDAYSEVITTTAYAAAAACSKASAATKRNAP